MELVLVENDSINIVDDGVVTILVNEKCSYLIQYILNKINKLIVLLNEFFEWTSNPKNQQKSLPDLTLLCLKKLFLCTKFLYFSLLSKKHKTYIFSKGSSEEEFLDESWSMICSISKLFLFGELFNFRANRFFKSLH